MKKGRFLTVCAAILLLISVATVFVACGKTKGKFTLTFYNNGEEYHSFNFAGEEVIELPADPIREGYDFDGWYFDEGTWNNPLTATSFLNEKLKENVDVFAKWVSGEAKETRCKVLFNSMDGSLVPPASVKGGDLVAEPSAPAKNGYILAGWYKEADYKTKWNFDVDAVKSDMTLFAKWTAEKYTVSFDSCGGDPVSDKEVEYGKEFSFAVPVKAGYDFAGWETEAGVPLTSGSGAGVSRWNIAGAAELRAGWILHEYGITYENTFGAENANPAVYTVETGITELEKLPDGAGRHFEKWQDENGMDVAFINPGETRGDVVLKAVWSMSAYDISYILGKGACPTGVGNPETYTAGDEFDLLPPETNEGFAFDGWYTAETGGEKIERIERGSAGDIILYARCGLIEYAVSYTDINGVSNDNPSGYNVETETITLLPPGARAGYDFAGWQTADGSAITEIPKGSAGDLVIRAIWELIEYGITYENLQGAEQSNPAKYNVESADITLNDPADRTGYTFAGWYDAASGGNKITEIPQGSAENKTLYARWEANEYTVSLDSVASPSCVIKFDGNGASTEIPDQTVTEATAIAYPSVPKRDGFIFAGWYADAGCTGAAYDFTSTVYGDMTLYAKWTETSNDIIDVGGTADVALNGTTRHSFDFVPLASGNLAVYTTGGSDTYGYLLQNGSQAATDDDGGDSANFRISYNVTAGRKYTVQVRGYGSGTVGTATLCVDGKMPEAGGRVSGGDTKRVTYGSEYNLGVPADRPGYRFLGWYTGMDCGGTKLTDDAGAGLAVWNALADASAYSGYEIVKYTVAFVTNLGSAVDSVELNYGDRLDLNAFVTAREKYSFAGWYLDVNDESPYEATTMPARNLTLNAKWITYSLSNLKYNEAKKAISVNDAVSAALFDAVLIDTDGDEVEISAAVNGEQTVGNTVQVRLLATGKYETKKQVTISDVKVYGMPSLTYDEERTHFSLSDTVNAALWNASGTDAFGAATEIRVRASGEDLKGGDIVDVTIESVDLAGNVASATITGVKVYDKPVLTYDEDRTAIKAADAIGSELWHASAADNFDEPLEISVTVKEGAQTAGGTIVVRFSATDCKGNVNDIDLSVRVYGEPVINAPDRTDLKATDEITVPALGLTATDSHGGDVRSVEIELSSGEQIGGASMVYAVTATDLVGNVSTGTVTVKIYDVPVLSTSKTGIRDIDDATKVSTFGVSAKDSFGNDLDVSYALKSGSQTSGSVQTYSFSATDAAGNAGTADFSYRVYSADGITLKYAKGASNLIKLTSKGEEFGFSAKDSFGDPVEDLRVLAAFGEKKGGNTISVKLRATDVLGNFKDGEVIENIKVYDVPTAVYANKDLYIKPGQNIDFMFIVKDSFEEELSATAETVSETDELHTVRVKATDAAGNLFDETYELTKVAASRSYLALYVSNAKYGYKVLTQGESFTLPCETTIGNYTCWKMDGEPITDNTGASLAVWSGTDDYYRANASGELIQYTVTYVLDGGTNDSGNPSKYTIETAITLQAPSRTGYDFSGWQLADGTPITEIPQGSTGNLELRATWVPHDYVLTYENLHGASNSNLSKYTIETEDITLRNPEDRAGYTFAGWFDSATGENKVTKIAQGSTGNKTLYARWVLHDYTITYENLQGSTHSNPATYNIESTDIVLSAPTERAHYTFSGWYDAETGGNAVTEIPQGSTGDRTLYARWTPIEYTITYENLQGTEQSNPGQYNIESTDIVLSAPTERAHYTFSGWYDAETGGTAITEIAHGSYGDKTLYARWTPIQYSVTYVLNGGTNNPANPSSYTIEDLGSADGTILLQDPKKAVATTAETQTDGTVKWSVTTYAFEGWYTDAAFTTPVTALSLSLGTVTLYAKWNASTSNYVSDKSYLRINADYTANSSGDYILFGEYPQTKVTDSATLSALGDYSSNTWTSYGYYISGSVGSFMKYKDKDYGGEKYRGVYFTSYRPYWCYYPSSADNSCQDGNGYNLSTVYWFRYEPIKWRILNEEGGKALILCEMAIDSQQWDYDGSYKNNYKESTIRKWLNETFYNTAFSGLQQELIQTTLVDNSVSSTGDSSNSYACANTNDKIFLLSYKEATNVAYGLNSDAARVKKSTDYAQSQGCCQSSGNSYWWLRSPFSGGSDGARIINFGGYVSSTYVYHTNDGVVPALTISL